MGDEDSSRKLARQKSVGLGETLAIIFAPGTLAENAAQIDDCVPAHEPESVDSERRLSRSASLRLSTMRQKPSQRGLGTLPTIPSEGPRNQSQVGLAPDEPSDAEKGAEKKETMVIMGYEIPRNWKKLISFAWTNFKAWLGESWTNWIVVLWMLAVVVDGAILFLALVQALKLQLTTAEAAHWVEVTSQIMNGLFMAPALITHPERIRHVYLYFKDRPKVKQERGHPAAMPDKLTLYVLICLNMNNILQYCLAGVMWGYSASARPPELVAIFLVGSFSAIIIGGFLEARWIQKYVTVTKATEGELEAPPSKSTHSETPTGGGSNGGVSSAAAEQGLHADDDAEAGHAESKAAANGTSALMA